MYILKEAMSFSQALTIFGIATVPDATELKALHKKLSLKNHPDRGGSLSKMQDINAAYDILKNQTGTSTTQSSRFNWEAVYEKNKLKFGLMKDFFEQTYDSNKIKTYLEGIFGQQLTVETSDNTPKAFFKNTPVQNSDFPTSYAITVSLFSEDKKTYFTVYYSIDPRYTSEGSLGSSDLDERDIIYNINTSTSFYYNTRSLKLSNDRYSFKYNVGIKKFLDPKELFPEDKIKKAMGKSSSKIFKKADMLLGLKRELNASFNGDTIFVYPLGKIPDSLVVGFYFAINRLTIMRQAAYSIRGFRHMKNGKMTTTFGKTITFYEFEDEFNKLVEIVQETAKEAKRKNLQIVEDGEKLAQLFIERLNELKVYVDNKYNLR
jgi:hypothetical protein